MLSKNLLPLVVRPEIALLSLWLAGCLDKGHVNHTESLTWSSDWGSVQSGPDIYWLRTPWSHHSENWKKSLNNPIGNITVAFFGKIQDVPINFPMGTSRSHDLEHCSRTTGKTARTFWMSHLVHCSYFLWENSGCPHQLPNGNIAVTWPGTLWMYWSFPGLEKLHGNW